MFQGFLPIDKPVGMRSAACVERIKRILGRGAKVGHGGTLDSTACGALVLLLGGATRLSSFVMQMPKRYRAGIKLGVETTTCDYSGEPTILGELGDAGVVTGEDVDAVIPSFIGWRMQIPPEVSAVHVGGRRAHEIFRSGGVPDIKPRPVFIESIRRVGSISESREIELLIRCGKGTYIRALARDIGRRLGCRAHIASLRREAVGPFAIDYALAFDEDSTTRDCVEAAILPIDFLGSFLPRYTVGENDLRALSAGREIPLYRARRETSGECCPDSTILASGGSFITVGCLKPSKGITIIKPQINIERTHSLAEDQR